MGKKCRRAAWEVVGADSLSQFERVKCEPWQDVADYLSHGPPICGKSAPRRRSNGPESRRNPWEVSHRGMRSRRAERNPDRAGPSPESLAATSRTPASASAN